MAELSRFEAEIDWQGELTADTRQVLVTSMCIGTGMGAAAVFVRDRLY